MNDLRDVFYQLEIEFYRDGENDTIILLQILYLKITQKQFVLFNYILVIYL